MYQTTEDLSILSSLPPQNIEAEEAILGAILLQPPAIDRVKHILTPDMFYVQAHGEIYRAMLAIDRKGSPPDLLLVISYLQDKGRLDDIGGNPRLMTLVDRTVSVINMEYYAELVHEKYIRRQTQDVGRKIVELGFDRFTNLDTYLDTSSRLIGDILGDRKPGEDKNLHRFNRTIEALKEIEQKIIDPAYREFRLMQLSKELGIPVKGLSTLYTKYLACRENESPMTIEELRKEYGSSVQEWFLHGFAPKGSVVLLHALGGTGKTRLIYDWIYHMVTGTPWNGFQVTAPSRRVLIVQTDESQSDLLNALDTRGFTSDMDIRIKTRWGADHIAALRKDIEEFKPEIILIDSLTSINRNSLYSENDTEYARPVLELRDLAQEFGCLIYLIHHSNSEGGSRGTKAIVNSVSHVLSLKRPEGNSDPRTLDRLLIVEKSRSRAPAKYKLTYDPMNGSWECEKFEKDPDTPTKDRIVRFLLENPGVAYEPIEVANEIGGSLDRVRSALYELSDEGAISRKRRYAQGGGYLYFLAYEGDRPEADRLPIESPITFKNPISESVPAEGDHPIEKISAIEPPEVEKIEEEVITFAENEGGESVSKVDREGDREGDRQEPDHLPADPSEEEDFVTWKDELWRVVGRGNGYLTVRKSGFNRCYKAPIAEITQFLKFPKS